MRCSMASCTFPPSSLTTGDILQPEDGRQLWSEVLAALKHRSESPCFEFVPSTKKGDEEEEGEEEEMGDDQKTKHRDPISMDATAIDHTPLDVSAARRSFLTKSLPEDEDGEFGRVTETLVEKLKRLRMEVPEAVEATLKLLEDSSSRPSTEAERISVLNDDLRNNFRSTRGAVKDLVQAQSVLQTHLYGQHSSVSLFDPWRAEGEVGLRMVAGQVTGGGGPDSEVHVVVDEGQRVLLNAAEERAGALERRLEALCSMTHTTGEKEERPLTESCADILTRLVDATDGTRLSQLEATVRVVNSDLATLEAAMTHTPTVTNDPTERLLWSEWQPDHLLDSLYNAVEDSKDKMADLPALVSQLEEEAASPPSSLKILERLHTQEREVRAVATSLKASLDTLKEMAKVAESGGKELKDSFEVVRNILSSRKKEEK